MTDFDFSALADRPPSKFKVLQADKTQFRVEQKSTNVEYKIEYDTGGYYVYRMNRVIDKEWMFAFQFWDLRKALRAIGYVR